MKKIFAFLMLMSIVFSLVSCNQENPSATVDVEKETTNSKNDENTNNAPENKDPTIENSTPPPYFTDDWETFLSDFEQDATLRDWFFYQVDIYDDYRICKDLPSVTDTIIIPKLKTDQFVCKAISPDGIQYWYYYYPLDVVNHLHVNPEHCGGFVIGVYKDPNNCSKWGENRRLEIHGDYAYEESRAHLYLNEDGQEVQIYYDVEVLCLDNRAAIEEIIEFERYGFNENGLYLITEE